MSAVPAPPEPLLADLNAAQREAVTLTTGPLAILAGAGTGKTRVISRRAAYAAATGAVPSDHILLVTFTDKAATDMVERLASLGLRGVTARTFHAHALSQLRHFWPSRHGGAALPAILDSKVALLGPIVRRLPGHYRFTPAKDVADEIEWAKARRIAPRDYEARLEARTPPIPADLVARVFADYERAKERAGRIDFDDMLALTVDLLETDAEAAGIVRSRKRWFSVDEYQDTNPLQQALLELWAGDSRDICVVGDEDQTIYSFNGATSAFLTGFAERHPGARIVALTENYRSTPQVLSVANRLLAADGRTKRLTATRADGPAPTLMRHATADAELTGVAAGIARLLSDGVPAREIAVLVRMNAQLALLEEALTRAAITYRVRGLRFYERPEVRAAIDALGRVPAGPAGPGLRAAVRELWQRELGYDAGDADTTVAGDSGGAEERERAAAFETLLAILDELLRARPDADTPTFAAELRARASHERASAGDGVNLLTYHRAKGLEWDAVFLPMLEEGSLPVRASAADDELAEERRLLYVGITRARVHLALSWAERRESRGREVRRRRSRFLDGLLPPPARRVVRLPDAPEAARADDARGADADSLVAALRAWRTTRARADAVPAYVIAHDRTLVAIAEARPATLAALRRVNGMGPAKLEKYGDEILAVVAGGA